MEELGLQQGMVMPTRHILSWKLKKYIKSIDTDLLMDWKMQLFEAAGFVMPLTILMNLLF